MRWRAGRTPCTWSCVPTRSSPPRDPYEFYGVPRLDALTIERAPVSGPAAARRLGYLAFAFGRAIGRDRPDVVFTRDLGVAALLRRPAGRCPAAGRLRIARLRAGRRVRAAGAGRHGRRPECPQAAPPRQTRSGGLAAAPRASSP